MENPFISSRDMLDPRAKLLPKDSQWYQQLINRTPTRLRQVEARIHQCQEKIQSAQTKRADTLWRGRLTYAQKELEFLKLLAADKLVIYKSYGNVAFVPK